MNDRVYNVLERKGHNVDTVPFDTTVFAAVEHMNERHIGAVLVADREGPVGIFTERDVLMRVVARGLDPKTTRVSEVMTRNPISIRPDVTITEAMMVITERRCRHLPVIDDGGLCGLISIGDLTSWMVQDQQRTIDDLHDYIQRT